MNAIAVRTVEKDRIPNPADYGRPMVEAERDAEELLAIAWKKRGPTGLFLPVDPFQIAMDLGISVLTGAKFPREMSGGLRKAPGYRDPEILISPHDSRSRQRFTCAHELGHYTDRVKGGDDGRWDHVDGRDLLLAGGQDPEDDYANRFAAELLMPGEIVLDRMDGSNVSALAFDFGVTADVMRFRLDTLERRLI